MSDTELGEYTPYKIAMLKLQQIKDCNIGSKLLDMISKTSQNFNIYDLPDDLKIQEQELLELKALLSKIQSFDFQKIDNTLSSYDYYANYSREIDDFQHKLYGVINRLGQSSEVLKANLHIEPIKKNLGILLSDLKNNAQIINNPTGVLDMLWIVRDEIAWLNQNNINISSHFHQEYYKHLKEIEKDLLGFRASQQPAAIESVIKTVQLLESKATSEEEKSLVLHLQAIKKECLIVKYNIEMLAIRERLDVIQGELISNLDKSNHAFKFELTQLKRKYKIKDKNKKKKKSFWGNIKSALSFLNLAQTYRDSQYYSKIQKLQNKHTQEKRELTEAHKNFYGEEWEALHQQIKIMEADLKEGTQNEELKLSLPVSYVEHRNLKQQIVQHHGMVIGGISQGRISELGSSSGICYGISKEFLVRVNAYRAQDYSDAEMIDKLDMYAKKVKSETDLYASAVNNLTDDFKYRHYYADQVKEKKGAVESGLGKTQNLSEEFWRNAIKTLENNPSLILNLHKETGGGHAIAIAKTEHGIWFHDSNYCCVLFPNQGDEQSLMKNVSTFLSEHVQYKYKDMVRGSMVAISDQRILQSEPLIKDTVSWVATKPTQKDPETKQSAQKDVEPNRGLTPKK